MQILFKRDICTNLILSSAFIKGSRNMVLTIHILLDFFQVEVNPYWAYSCLLSKILWILKDVKFQYQAATCNRLVKWKMLVGDLEDELPNWNRGSFPSCEPRALIVSSKETCGGEISRECQLHSTPCNRIMLNFNIEQMLRCVCIGPCLCLYIFYKRVEHRMMKKLCDYSSTDNPILDICN